jgi:predicted DNA-binding transcriptional regulator AlpA
VDRRAVGPVVIALDAIVSGDVFTADDVPSILARVAAINSAVAIVLATGAHSNDATTEDRRLGVNEAAVRLGVTAQWLYRHARTLPFVQRLGRKIGFSARGIGRYLQRRGQ